MSFFDVFLSSSGWGSILTEHALSSSESLVRGYDHLQKWCVSHAIVVFSDLRRFWLLVRSGGYLTTRRKFPWYERIFVLIHTTLHVS